MEQKVVCTSIMIDYEADRFPKKAWDLRNSAEK